MFSQHQINSCSRMKFCKCTIRFVIIYICKLFQWLYQVHVQHSQCFYRGISAITTLWPVKCFPWSRGVHELDIYITLLLVNFAHQSDPPQQAGISKSWMSTIESSSLHSLCPICDTDWGMKLRLLLVPGTVLPSSNLFSIFSHLGHVFFVNAKEDN